MSFTNMPLSHMRELKEEQEQEQEEAVNSIRVFALEARFLTCVAESVPKTFPCQSS